MLLATFSEALAVALRTLAVKMAEVTHPSFDFCVIDEAQDIGVAELRFLSALGGGRLNSLFFAGDLGQRIFQTPFSWRALGVDVRGRSHTLRINYRTSHQIRRQADRLLPPELADVDGNAERRGATVSVFNGPVPEVRTFDSPEDETEAIADWLRARQREGYAPQAMGVFVRSPEQIGRALSAVQAAGMRPAQLDDGSGGTGASVRAANWVRVGETRGRGRQDRRHAAPETRKAVYMYALEPAWRDTLQAPAPGVLPLAVGDGLDAASWAGHEFGGARLGDARLSARLVLSAEQMAESPMRAITGAANAVRALVKGHYRLIDQPAESAVTVENILAPHRERTLRRMRTHDTVLCIQDGTRLNFTRRSQTRGLGTIGSNQTGAAARGLDLHTTLAVNPDGVALGVLRAAFDAPEPPTPEEKGQPKPREERKSFRWVEGLRDCAAAAEQLGETRVVCTMDREADFLDLFIERRTHAPQVELLVRAKVDRVLGQQKTADGHTVSRRLFDEVRDAPARGAAMVEVRRLSARVKASKQPPKDGRAARVAEVTLRYQPVALPCPGTEPVELFVVHAREQQAPPAVKPLEWFVLTTLPVTSAGLRLAGSGPGVNFLTCTIFRVVA